jgi:hypothetical protein
MGGAQRLPAQQPRLQVVGHTSGMLAETLNPPNKVAVAFDYLLQFVTTQ